MKSIRTACFVLTAVAFLLMPGSVAMNPSEKSENRYVIKGRVVDAFTGEGVGGSVRLPAVMQRAPESWGTGYFELAPALHRPDGTNVQVFFFPSGASSPSSKVLSGMRTPEKGSFHLEVGISTVPSGTVRFVRRGFLEKEVAINTSNFEEELEGIFVNDVGEVFLTPNPEETLAK